MGNVRLVELPPLPVVAFHAYGPSPEREAMAKMLAWAEQQGIRAGSAEHRVFGFDNPTPSPGSPNYGYEFWLVVEPEEIANGAEEVVIAELPGGCYAALRCEAAPDGSNIPGSWAQLARWLEESPYYYPPQRPCLEEHLGPLTPAPQAFVLDLLLPVTE